MNTEEKKLDKDINVRSKDDTEIDVGMIERSIEREKYLTIWLYKDSFWESYSLSKILDLIHRLQGEKKLAESASETYKTIMEGQEKIIDEQKAEIERLTEENERLDKLLGEKRIDELKTAREIVAQNCILNEENAELQKQVDELEKELEKAYITERANIQAEIAEAGTSCHWCKNVTVKDTAKEILKWLKAEVIMTEIPHGSEPCEEDVEAVMWWQIEEHFKKKYGVEVE